MILRLRRWARNENVGVAAAVSFAMMYALWQVCQASVGGVIYPVILHLFGKDDIQKGYRLNFTRLGIDFDVSLVVTNGLAFLLLAVATYLLFVRPIAAEAEVEPWMRECPECKSEIVVDATRCPFCTTVVTPLPPEDVAEVSP